MKLSSLLFLSLFALPASAYAAPEETPSVTTEVSPDIIPALEGTYGGMVKVFGIDLTMEVIVDTSGDGIPTATLRIANSNTGLALTRTFATAHDDVSTSIVLFGVAGTLDLKGTPAGLIGSLILGRYNWSVTLKRQ